MNFQLHLKLTGQGEWYRTMDLYKLIFLEHTNDLSVGTHSMFSKDFVCVFH